MKEMINFNWKLLGAKLATLDNLLQADFLKGFASELKKCCDTSLKTEMQLLYVRDVLDDETKEFLKEYLPCLWEKNETKS
jgi:hypothetical protein